MSETLNGLLAVCRDPKSADQNTAQADVMADLATRDTNRRQAIDRFMAALDQALASVDR